MIRAKILSNRDVVVIEDGKSYLFDLGGKCYKEDAGLLPKYTDGMQEFNILSILSSNNKVEIGCFQDNSLRKFSVSNNAMDCALAIQMQGNFVRMLRKDGISDNTKYNQLIFLYTKETDLVSKLSKLNIKEI